MPFLLHIVFSIFVLMKRLFLIGSFLACFAFSTAQELVKEQLNDTIDVKYREDQYYISVTYNLLNNKVSDLSQSGFSPGLHIGVIRDIPLNKNRNFGIGVGLGYSGNVINQNLAIDDINGNFDFTTLASDDFIRNNLIYHTLELPFEVRWRTSNSYEYAFWRIYTGFRLGYVIGARSRLQAGAIDQKTQIVDAMNRWQYGLTLSAGNDKINAYMYYGLNALFNNDQLLNGEPIDVSTLKIGLILYIL